MKILLTSIVDLKKSQHNRPNQLVKHLSWKHEITVHSINDWWNGGQEKMALRFLNKGLIFKGNRCEIYEVQYCT